MTEYPTDLRRSAPRCVLVPPAPEGAVAAVLAAMLMEILGS
ncbi:MAG TPA: hypothetical protein VGJ38_04185 [Jatrophihabitantaceae bacterium]